MGDNKCREEAEMSFAHARFAKKVDDLGVWVEKAGWLRHWAWDGKPAAWVAPMGKAQNSKLRKVSLQESSTLRTEGDRGLEFGSEKTPPVSAPRHRQT